MKEIQLTKGFVALVDDEDYETINKHHWYTSVRSRANYAKRDVYHGGRRLTEFMHRVIMDCPEGMYIDHINHNGLDNRKENLRICTNQENCRNRIKHAPTTLGMIKGVSISKCIKSKPFRAHIKHNYKNIDIGFFANLDDAARAYDKKALELFGQYAQLNYPLKIE